jgi:IPT/TIG domain/Putative Ig domain/Glycosyl hydrolase catalytic core
MSSPRLTRCPKTAVLISRQSCILFSMILTLVAAFLVGCVGNARPSKPTSAPASSVLRIATTSLAAGSAGGSYSSTLTATGGTPPYTWGVRDGVLPTGLHLNVATGTITGAPSVAGTYPFTVYVQDSRANSVSGTLYLNVNPPPGPSISGISPNNGPMTGGTAVTISGNNFLPESVVQFGGIPATSVQVVSPNAIRCITPNEPVGAVSVTVSDSGSQATTVQNDFTFSASPLQIATASLPAGSVGTSYSTTLMATGGVPPYSWSAKTGVLPTGVSLASSAGLISGTPMQSGTYPVAIQIKDSKSTSSSANLSLVISPDPAPTINGVSPNNGPTFGGTVVTISGANFRSGATISFGSVAASSVQIVSPTQIQATAPAETAATVNVSVQNPNGQVISAPSAFAFTAPAPAAAATPSADVIVDASQTVSETGRDDLAAAKNIYSSASSPESNGGLSDWGLISSEFAMTRMRNINGLGDCALDSNGNLTGCSRLNNDLNWIKIEGLTPHVIVGQWDPASIPGDPRQWGASQWAQYDALSYAIVNYVVNGYGGTGFNEALFEVENELDITQSPQDLWLTTTPNVPQGDPSRFAQYDTVYSHWAKAVSTVAGQNPSKKVRIAAPATGFWTIGNGSGQLWQNQIIPKYAAQGIRLDIVSLHIYGSDASVLANYAQSIRSALTSSGNSQAEIWVTEWGASSSTDSYLGAINASHQGAAWSIYFLLQALKGTITGGSFLQVRDNQGTDTAGVNSNMYLATWDHVKNNTEYPKAISNAFSMVGRMTGSRKSVTLNSGKPNLYALSSSDSSSATLIVANYNYVFDYSGHNFSDVTTNESVTVAFKNLLFTGPVTVDRYLIDAQTSNLNYWIAAGNTPPSVPATQLQKVESFSATVSSGVISLPARQLGPSGVSMWIVHQ